MRRPLRRNDPLAPPAAAKRDKYDLYERAVQSPEFEVPFIRRLYQRVYGCEPTRLREDFCGTAALACEWARRVPEGVAWAIDIDAEVLAEGRRRHLEGLGAAAARVRLVRADVLEARGFRPEVVVAFNFSWCAFKRREQLRRYFLGVRRRLQPKGLFLLDIYGGPEAQVVQEEETQHDGFTYIWDQAAYNPITGEYRCHIHFYFPDGTRLRNAFSYEWRLWGLPEVRDLLLECGFRRVEIYWEGTNHKTNGGNGVYRRSLRGDNSVSWIAYLAASK